MAARFRLVKYHNLSRDIYLLVMTHIAMENPNHKWRLMSLGKSSISIRAIYTMAMLNNQMVFGWNMNTTHKTGDFGDGL